MLSSQLWGEGMNYYDEGFTTDKLIQLVVDTGDNHQYPAPMTQDAVAKFCETCPYPVDAFYADGVFNEWIGSTEI